MPTGEALCYDGCGRPALPDADVCEPCAAASHVTVDTDGRDVLEEYAIAADEAYAEWAGK